MTLPPRLPVSVPALALAIALGSTGCQTTTVEQGTDYQIASGKSDSILDSELRNLVDQLKEYPKRDDLHYRIAGIYWQKEDYRNCAKALERALALSPHDAKYHLRLGQVYCTFRELDQAEEHFREVVRLLPEDRYSGPHAALGFLLDMKKDTEGAIAQFEKCVAIDPDNTEYYYALGSLQDIRGDREDAIQSFQEYLVRGGSKYRSKAIFFLEKLGVKVENLPPPRARRAGASPEDLDDGDDAIFGRGFRWDGTPQPDSDDLPPGATPIGVPVPVPAPPPAE